MEKMYGYLITALMILTACGCTPGIESKGSFIRLKSSISAEQPVSADSVEVFYEKQPSFSFEEIGIVEGIVMGKKAGLQDLFPVLKKQAAEMGAMAIYKIRIQRHNHGNNALHGVGIAIVEDTSAQRERKD